MVNVHAFGSAFLSKADAESRQHVEKDSEIFLLFFAAKYKWRTLVFMPKIYILSYKLKLCTVNQAQEKYFILQ